MESEEEDFSIVLSEEQMRRVEVPGDGSCLFWAIAFPYLIQANNNPDLFNQRFEKLFGEKELIHSHHVHNLINEFRTSHHNNNIYDDEILKRLVTQTFRHKLVDRMSQCEDEFYESVSIKDFKDMKNESFLTDGTFRSNCKKAFAFLSDRSKIDFDRLQPEILDENSIKVIYGELVKIVNIGCGDLLQRRMFLLYLEAMKICGSFGGNREIEIMTRMLESDILINPKHVSVSDDDNNIICLLNNQQIHYQFIQIKAEFLIEFIDQNSEEKSLEYLKIGVDEINYQNSNGSTLLHFAAKNNHVRSLHLLINQGAETNIRNHLGQTPLDIATSLNSHVFITAFNSDVNHDLSVVGSKQKNSLFLVSKQTHKSHFDSEICTTNAIFNLIVLENTELLEKHINQLVKNKPIFLNEVLPKAYETVKLLNIPLTSSVSLFIESQIIQSRLFSDRKVNEIQLKIDRNNIDDTQQRINIVINAIKKLEDICLHLRDNNYISDEFLFFGKFIAQNMQSLKNQLHFSYDKLPWIEMQFCLINFISGYSEGNVDAISTFVLNEARLIKHLLLFKTELEKLNVDVKLDNKYPFTNRSKIIDSVLEINSNFKDLYEDYELLRDIYSLNRIESYLNSACLVDLKEGDVLVGEQVILRALQVTGECLKSTIESPNMSDKVHHLLITLAPNNVIKIVTSLRDSLSHVEHLHKGNTTEQNSLVDIQKDLIKLKEEITFILFLMRNFALEIFFKRLSECENVNQAEDIVLGVRYNELREVDLTDKQNEIFDKVVELIEKFKSEIQNAANVQEIYFQKLEHVIERQRLKLMKVKQKHINNIKAVDSLIYLIYQKRDVDLIRKRAASMVVLISYQMINDATFYEEILENCAFINNSLEERSLSVINLYFQIFYLIEFEAKRVKSIDSFRKEMAKEMHSDDEIERTNKVEEYANNILENISEEFFDNENKRQFLYEIEIKKVVFRSKNKLVNYYSKINEVYNNIVYFYDDFGVFFSNLINFFSLVFNFNKEKKAGQTVGENKFIKLIEENKLNDLLLELNLKNLIDKNAFKILMENIQTCNLGENNFDDIFSQINFEKLIEEKKLIDKNLFKILLGELRKNQFSSVTNKSKKIKDEVKVASLIDEVEFNALIDEIKRDFSLDENSFKAFIASVQLKLGKNESSAKLFNDTSFLKCKTSLQSLKRIDGKFDSFGKLVKDVSKESEISKLSEPFSEFIKFLNVNFNEEIDIIIGNAFEKIKIEQIIQFKKYFFEKLETLAKIFPSEKSDLELLDLLKTDNIRIAVEMLVLNLTQTLDQLSLFEKNRLFLDEFSPVLVGKHLRNYLAHGDPLINILPTNYHISLINHFRLFQREFHKGEFYSGKYLIGKVTKENLAQVQNYYQQNMTTLDKKNRLFNLAMKGNLQDFINSTDKSLYFKVRDIFGNTLLHSATQTNNLPVFQHLLERGLSVFIENKHGHSALHTALRTGSERIIKFLLDKGFNSSFICHKSETLLHLAVKFRQLSIVKLLLKYGADIEAADNRGMKPVMKAVIAGDESIVIELLNAGSDLESRDKSGKTLLHLATSNVKILKLLLERTANVNAADHHLNTPLLLACESGEEAVVKMLLNNNANVNTRNRDGKTALHSAVQEGHAKIVQLLLHENVEIDTPTVKNSTALHFACFHGHFEIAQLLLKHGANLNLRYKDMTALHMATMMGQVELIDALLDYQAEIDGLCSGISALHFAAELGLTAAFKKLVERGADLSLRGENGFSALHSAALLENLEMMTFILEKDNSLVNAVSDQKRTALHAATLRNKIKSVIFLLENGADLEAKDFEQNSPLMMAASRGHTEVFNVLLSKGANCKARNASGWSVVLAAAEHNYVAVVSSLIQRKIDVNVQSDDGTAALLLASQNGHLETVELLLKNAARIDLANSNGWNALHFAAYNGHAKIVRYLLKKNARTEFVDSTCDDKWTALHLAAMKGHEEVVRDLVVKVTNVDAPLQSGYTALYLAVESGNVLCVNFLMENGADVNIIFKGGWTALHFAAMKGQNEIVKTLIGKVTNVDAKLDNNGLTALNLAADNNFFDAVETLLSNGANANCMDSNGKTVLQNCCTLGHTKIALCLLKYGANVEAGNSNKKTALHYAAENGHLEIVKRLLEYKANANTVDLFGQTILCLAINKGHSDVVEHLLTNGAEPNIRMVKGNSALHLAADRGFVRIAESILKHDESEVDIKNVVGETPLHISATKGHTQIVQLLLNKNANVNAVTEERSTALHFASCNGHLETAQLLLSSGAIVDFPNKNELTPLHVAVLSGHLEVAKILIERGADVLALDDHDSVLHKAVLDEKMLAFILIEIEMKVNGDVDQLRRVINARDKDGDTPLMWAAQNGNLNAVKLLLKCDVLDMNIQNVDSMTALHWAAQEGHRHVVEFLIANKANVGIKNNKGHTVFDLALQ